MQRQLKIDPLAYWLNLVLLHHSYLWAIVFIVYFELFVASVELDTLVVHHQHLVSGAPLLELLAEAVDSALEFGFGGLLCLPFLFQLLFELFAPLLYVLAHVDLILQSALQVGYDL